MATYQHIVFLQGDDYDEMIAELFPDREDYCAVSMSLESVAAIVGYLAQWDYGEGEIRDTYDAETMAYQLAVDVIGVFGNV